LEELERFQFEVIEEMSGECESGAFADADDSDVGASDDTHIELWEPSLEGEGGHEAGAACAHDNHVADGHVDGRKT
jgi:hypothetical protein